MTSADSLESRVARLEARADIQELLARYALLIDDHNYAALGELFAEDAVFAPPGGTRRGRQEIVAGFRVGCDRYPISRHETHGTVLKFDDADHARGQVIGFCELASGEQSVVTSFRYDDVYVREDGRWLFASRTVHTLYAMTHTELADGGLSRKLRKRWPHDAPAPAELPADGYPWR